MAETAPTADSSPKQSVFVKDDEELQKIFNQFDSNKDGKISLEELGGVMKTMGSTYTQDELKRAMDDLDTDKDGFINLSEFATLCRPPSGASDEAELRDAFDLYDEDKNGLISAEELHRVLNRLGMTCLVEECVKMIKPVDSDGDGNVNFLEFRKMMTTSLKKP
ncbi:Calcium binding protein [Melia azedarach]|uniref:Calcium binding protein n=1 Tax=Melia azedarach TaxID=155640 RepID=A0ACC1XT90_MELAZ|nr:Calcium binding protein [Melia azedarach]